MTKRKTFVDKNLLSTGHGMLAVKNIKAVAELGWFDLVRTMHLYSKLISFVIYVTYRKSITGDKSCGVHPTMVTVESGSRVKPKSDKANKWTLLRI